MDDQQPIVAQPTAGPVQPIPGSIVKAVCLIQSTVEAVSKSQKNQHGGYMFASTDDIYAAITRKMGDVGLLILCMEEEAPQIVRQEKDGKTSQWGKFSFSFVLATADATWSDPRSRRSLMIQITGPQTFQAAQSYAEKSYLRSLFKLPTGDMDLDSMPQADTVEAQEALAGAGRKRTSSHAAKKDGKSQEVFNEIRQKIAMSGTRDMLMQVRTLYADEWSVLPRAWVEILDHEYEDRLDSLDMEGASP